MLTLEVTAQEVTCFLRSVGQVSWPLCPRQALCGEPDFCAASHHPGRVVNFIYRFDITKGSFAMFHI